MALKDQWKKIKDNWLIIVVLVLVVGFFYLGEDISYMMDTPSYSGDYSNGYGGSAGIMAESASYASMPSRMIKSDYYLPSPIDDGFAPEAEDRRVTKTATLSTEIGRGKFEETGSKIKSILSASNSYLLNENIGKYDVGETAYYHGNYAFKVEVQKYEAVITQLKQIGEVKSFTEQSLDVTGTYTNLQTELEAERARLERYKQMLADAELIADKIELNDRIFDQERTAKYLEEALQNQDQEILYSTIQLRIDEKRSDFAGMAFVSFGQLISNLVSSSSNLLELLFSVLPWAVVIALIWIGVRWIKKK